MRPIIVLAVLDDGLKEDGAGGLWCFQSARDKNRSEVLIMIKDLDMGLACWMC
ncbi:MAG: hypothetical protein ACP5PQ_00320 [Thermoproteota archaeon]